MDEEASDENVYDEDDDENDDDNNGEVKGQAKEDKHSSDRNDEQSVSPKEETTLPFHPSQKNVILKHKQAYKIKGEDKGFLKNIKDISVSDESAQDGRSRGVEMTFHLARTAEQAASTNSIGITGLSGPDHESMHNPSDEVSSLGSGCLQHQSASIDTSGRTGTSGNIDSSQPFNLPMGEDSRTSRGSTFNMLGNKDVHIKNEQSKLRLNRDLKPFVRTEKIKKCEKMLKDWGLLLLTGGPGEGKTTVGLHLLDLMSDSGFSPLILTDPQQWDHISYSKKKNKRYVILIDDAFGRTNLVEDLKTRWEQKFPMMLPLIEAGTVCVVFSFRINIYLQNEELIRASELFKRCKPVNLSSDDLSEKEKLEMLDFHIKFNSRKLSLPDDEKRIIIQCRDFESFPHCCYLFTSNIKQYESNFFHRSLKYIGEVVSSTRQNDSEGFLVLLLVMFYENLLPNRFFDLFEQNSQDKETFAKLSQVCTVTKSLGSLLNLARSMCQTLLIFDTNIKCFSFKHNSIQDAVFIEFCKSHLGKGLEMCSTRTLLEYVRTEKRSDQDIAVVVSKNEFDKLAARLIKELFSSRTSSVYAHQAFKDKSFLSCLFCFPNADIPKEISEYDRVIHRIGVQHYLKDTTFAFLVNKCLNQPTKENTFDRQYVPVLTIDSMPACFVLNKADRIVVRILKGMKHCEVLFSRHANKTLACAFYMNNKELADELIELGAKITFDCFNAVCVAPSVNENLVELAAGIISEEHADSLWNLLTLSLENGHVECIKKMVHFMASSGRSLQLEEFCRRLLILCHTVKPTWILVPHKQNTFNEIFELLHNLGVKCFTDSCVLLAAGCHDLQILKYLVKCGGNIHCKNDRGQGTLHLAALYGSGDTVMYLIQQDVEKHARDNDGYTPLHRAVQSVTESYEKVLLLADKNAQFMLNSGESVLDIAIKKGDIESVEYLCCQLSTKDGQLSQSLCTAVTELAEILSKPDGAENVLKSKLIENRCHFVHYLTKLTNYSLSDIDDSMTSSLTVLAERGNEDVFEAVINSCDLCTLCNLLKAAIESSQSMFSKLDCCVSLNMKDITNKTLLHFACESGYTAVVEYLVPRVEDVNAKDNQNTTPLQYAYGYDDSGLLESKVRREKVNIIDMTQNTPLRYSFKSGNTDIVKCLVKGGATVNVKDKYGKTPLHYACEHGVTAIVESFVQGGADVNVNDKDWKTPLHYACLRGDTDMVECLVQRGAEVNVKDMDGSTPLHACVRFDNAFVWCLVQGGARVNVTDKYGKTPLHYACVYGDTALVECLVQRGAEVNVKDKDDKTPIHYAREHGDTAMVECLVQKGAEVNVKDRKGKTPLHYACEHGDTAMVECLVLGGADVNVKNEDGKTPLHYDCVRGDKAFVECLLHGGAEVNVKDKNDKTPLHYACEHGDTALVEYFVQRGAEVNIKDKDDTTPLHYACEHGDTAMVECLVQGGADVNVKNDFRKIPLHYACLRGNIAIAECLFKGGAEVDIMDHNGNTPLHYACVRGDIAFVECLLHGGAEVNVKGKNDKTPLHYACEHGDTALVEYFVQRGAEVNIKDKDDTTPLHYACEHGDTAMVECLVQGGADVNVKNDFRKTPLHYACLRGDIAFVECLFKGGADVNVNDEDGKTPIHYACIRGDTAIVQCLLKGGAEVNVTDMDGNSPLQYACIRFDNALVGCLVQGGAEVNVEDGNWRTPLHYACARGDTAMVYCLVQRGAEVKVKDLDDKTPLHYACEHGDTAMVECLVHKGAKVNVKDKTERNPLHYACGHGDSALVECLVQRGAEVNVKDKDGKTPLHYACEHGDTAMVECLVQKGAKVNVKDKTERNPLHYACGHGDTAMVECLVQKGAKVNVKDKEVKTPLHVACEYGETAMVETLVQRSAKVNIEDGNWRTPLHYACARGDTAMVYCLIQRGAEVKVKELYDKTPLHYACEHGDTALVECLVQKGAKVNVKDKTERNPLHYACGHGNTAMVECLVQKGAKVNVKDKTERNPLHYACGHGDSALVECLVQRGAEVNVKDKDGKTPLHYAYKREDKTVVECLVQRGAEVKLVDH